MSHYAAIFRRLFAIISLLRLRLPPLRHNAMRFRLRHCSSVIDCRRGAIDAAATPPPAPACCAGHFDFAMPLIRRAAYAAMPPRAVAFAFAIDVLSCCHAFR